MNKRILSIIYALSKAEQEFTIDGLAEQFHVSSRTIRNDVTEINDILRENNLSELTFRAGGVIVPENDFAGIAEITSGGDFYDYKLSKEERKRIAAALLINSSEHITLSTIAENLFVSRATVINDLDSIKKFIKKGNLEVLSHPNKGLRVDGLESDKRIFLMKLSETRDDPAALKDVVSRHISAQAGNRIVLRKILSEQEHVYKSFLTDDSFQKILLYLGIMVNRNLQGEYMEPRRKNDNGKYRMAQDILKYVSQYRSFTTTEDEVQFLSELLSMARYMRQKSVSGESIRCQMLTRRFIETISEDLGINLNGDYEFYENLSNHLESVISSAGPVGEENASLDEVLDENPEVMETVTRNMDMIQQYAGREISEVEIKYIAIHICAALERKKNKEIAFHVILACHAGIGTSQLLMERLKTHFNFQIVDIISAHEAGNLTADKADFVISTVPLKDCKIEYVIVSPILTDEDYIHVGNKIDALRDSRHLPSRIEDKELTAKGLLEQLKPLIYEKAPEQAPELFREIRRTVRKYFDQSAGADAEIFAPALHHLLPAGHIQLDVECEDWRDAVRKSAAVLLEHGYIEKRYIDAMIANIEENGPYIVLSQGFAVPHEGVEQGSIKVGMNLIRLKRPVEFGAEELDPVEFVCCMSAVDHKTHLKAFFNLVNMLRNETFKRELRESRTPEEAARVIERYEYEAAE